MFAVGHHAPVPRERGSSVRKKILGPLANANKATKIGMGQKHVSKGHPRPLLPT